MGKLELGKSEKWTEKIIEKSEVKKILSRKI